MGVDYEFILFVGIQVADEKTFDDRDWPDEFEDEINGTPDAKLDCIYDGMSGDYVFLGKRIVSGDQQTEEIAQEIKSDLECVKDDVAVLLDERLPDWRKYGPVRMLFISHAT